MAILGGTGKFGKGLALRLCGEHRVVLGSRSAERAKEAAAACTRLAAGGGGAMEGADNREAVAASDVVVLAVKADTLEEFARDAAGYAWEGKAVLSVATRMERRDGVFYYRPFLDGGVEVSAAEYVQARLRGASVVSGMQMVPAARLADPAARLGYDVPMAGERKAVDSVVAALECIEGLRFLYAGPLTLSRYLESSLPLLLNLAEKNGIKAPGFRVA